MSIFMKWIVILRLYAIPASIIPISLASVWAYLNGCFEWIKFFLILIAGILIHLSGNLINTYYDYINGVDKEDSDDISLVKRLIEPRSVLRLSFVFLLIAISIGIYIVLKYKVFILIPVALLGIFLTIFYTANPLSLKYKALGEVVIFLCFGPLIVLGSVIIFHNQVVWEAVFWSVPPGLLIVNLLLSNNIRDYESDKQSNVKTIVDILGVDNSKKVYMALHILSYIFAFTIVGLSLSLLAFLPAILGSLRIIKLLNEQKYSLLNRESAKFIFLFGILFIISLLAG